MEHDSSIFGLKPAFQSQKTYCCVSSVLFMSATSRDNETVCVPSPFDNPAPASSRPRSNSSGNVSYGTSFAPFHQSDDPFGPPAFSSASASSSQPPPSFGEGPGTRGRTHSSAGVGYGGTVYGQPQGGYPGGYDPYAGGSCYGGGAGDFGGGVGGGGYGYGGAPQPFGAHSYAPSAPEMKMDDDFPVYFADEPEQFPGGPSSAPLPLGAAGRGRSESSVGVAPLDIRTCPVCKSLSDDLLMTLVIRCPQCDTKYCCFCIARLPDGLPCGKKPCRKKTKAMWKQEDKEFAEYNVTPMKLKRSTKVKRKFQNAGYGLGVGACGVASATMVAAGVVGVPFTAGFSLALIPLAAAPVAGGKLALDRRKRWVAQCKDKRRQTVRSQIIQSNDFDISGEGGPVPASASSVSVVGGGAFSPSSSSSSSSPNINPSSSPPPSYQP